MNDSVRGILQALGALLLFVAALVFGQNASDGLAGAGLLPVTLGLLGCALFVTGLFMPKGRLWKPSSRPVIGSASRGEAQAGAGDTGSSHDDD